MIINSRLEDHTKPHKILIEVVKEQVFSVPREESQMFTGKTYDFTEGNTYPNNIFKETVTGIGFEGNNSTRLARWNATDYIGLATYKVNHNINFNFVKITILNIETGVEQELDANNVLKRIGNGLYLLTIEPNILNILFVDEEETDVTKKFGQYIIKIEPLSFTTEVVDMVRNEHYPPQNLFDSGDHESFRRNVYHLNVDSFHNTPWSFETFPKQSGRLIGSVAEFYSGGVYKQTKVVNENDFNELNDHVKMVFSPDVIGYDPASLEIAIGDSVVIYPRESNFLPITINLNYVSDNEIKSEAYKYLLNDVVRDVTTGVYEIYDQDGLNINPDGTIDGKVIQTYQVQQIGKFEIRKKIRL